jgi:glutamate dehydrogenase (NAD(P)+)
MTWKWAGVDLFFGVPDFIANAGGVVAAAVAMDARYSGIQPEPAAVFDNISNKLRASTIETLAASQTQGRTTHEVARAIAQQRVREAMELRGRVPRAAAVHIPTESRR